MHESAAVGCLAHRAAGLAPGHSTGTRGEEKQRTGECKSLLTVGSALGIFEKFGEVSGIRNRTEWLPSC